MTLNIQAVRQEPAHLEGSNSKIILPTGYFPHSNGSADYRTTTIPPTTETSTIASAVVDGTNLSLRTPGEILAMHFDPNDLYVENGLFARGQPMTILGPGGVGKSRLLLQFAACTITGRPFLGWKVSTQKLKWLVIQAENSNRRLQADLAKMREWVGEGDWKTVEANLLIHTLERDHDAFLGLDNPASAELVARLVKDAMADVVVFDPLFAFASGNLNTDSVMLKTCRAITDLARLGRPNCAIVVLHHTLTGKEGAKKATGYDRASYGRGSKSLQFWTRGQLNVAPGSADNNGKLVISCGKNSNGPEFEPFGVVLDPATMVYEVDPEFDLETWKDELAGKTNSLRKPTPETIATLVKDLPLSRKDLLALVMDEIGCGKSSAYGFITKAEQAGTIRRDKKKQYTTT